MSHDHGLSDKSTAEARIQMRVVTGLEVQLKQEKVKLQAMMKHLHPKQNKTEAENVASPEAKRFRAESPSPPLSLTNLPKMTVPEMLKNSSSNNSAAMASLSSSPLTNPLAHLMSLAPSSHSMSPLAALSTAAANQAVTAGHGLPHSPTSTLSTLSSLSTPLRGTIHDKNSFPHHTSSSAGFSTGDSHRRRVTHHDRGNPNLDPEEDLSKNREFYRLQDVRPPYTYAALIRQVKI